MRLTAFSRPPSIMERLAQPCLRDVMAITKGAFTGPDQTEALSSMAGGGAPLVQFGRMLLNEPSASCLSARTTTRAYHSKSRNR